MSYAGQKKIRQPGGIRVRCTLDGWLEQDLDGNWFEPIGSCAPCDCLIFNNWGAPQQIKVSFGNCFSPDGSGGSCGAGCGFLNDFVASGYSGPAGDNIGQGPFTLKLVYSGGNQSADGCLTTNGTVYVPLQGVWTGWNTWYPGKPANISTYYLGFNCAAAAAFDPSCSCTPMAYRDINNTGWSDAARFCTWQSDEISINDICGSNQNNGARIAFTLAYDPNRQGWGVCASLSVGAYGAAGYSDTTWYCWVFTNLGEDNPSGMNCGAGCTFPPPSLPVGQGGTATPVPSTIVGKVGCDNETQANPCFDVGTMIATKIALGKYYFYEWQNWYDPTWKEQAGGACGVDLTQPLDFTVPLYSNGPRCPNAPTDNCTNAGDRPIPFLCVTCGTAENHWHPQTVKGCARAGCSGTSKTAPPCCCGGEQSPHTGGKPCFYLCLKPSDPADCDMAVAIELCPVKGQNNTYQGCSTTVNGTEICATLTYDPDAQSWSLNVTSGGASCLSPDPFTPGNGGWQNVNGGIQLGGGPFTPSGSCCASGTVSVLITANPNACWGGAALPCCADQADPAGTLPAEITVTLPGLSDTVPFIGANSCTNGVANPCPCSDYAGDYVLTLSAFDVASGTATYTLSFGPLCGVLNCFPVSCNPPADVITAKISCTGAKILLQIGNYECITWISDANVGAGFPCCEPNSISLPWGLTSSLVMCPAEVVNPCFLAGSNATAGTCTDTGTPGAASPAVITWGGCPPK